MSLATESVTDAIGAALATVDRLLDEQLGATVSLPAKELYELRARLMFVQGYVEANRGRAA